MGPNSTPEQKPPEKSQAQRAQEAANRAIQQIRSSYESKFADLKNIQDDGERGRARAQLAQEAAREMREEINQLKTSVESGQVDRPEEVKEKANNAKKTFLKIKELSKEGVTVVDSKSQLIVDKIVEKIKSGEITDQGVLAIERNIGKQLIDGAVFSAEGQPLSDFEVGLNNLMQVDQQAAFPIIEDIRNHPETYGTSENIRQKLNLPGQENNTNEQREQSLEEISARAFEGDFIQYYRSRFTQDQVGLLSTFYSPEAFVSYMEQLSKRSSDGRNTLEAIQAEKQEIAEKIKKYWEEKKKPLNEEQIKEEVDKQWGEKVSNDMNWQVSDIINQLFMELQQKSPNKFYEEIMQEDPFQGPGMIQKKIQAALNSLMTKVDQIGKDESDPLAQRMKNLKLYRTAADPGYIEERGSSPDAINKNLYPRLHPLPYGEKINNLSEFVQYINTTIDQTIHKAEYFHNSRAIYGHPAGEKGFYGQLGGFAESLKGADIDEIMLLPDGKYVMQAYQLYEKMLEEDFASLDWKHRPDQFTNQLERVNSKIELEVFEQLRGFYPDLTRERVRNIVNSGVGIARGVFLTEPEKSAYADAVDSEGRGMVASYSTNDAQSLNVFNPLHNALRWQGEHNWNMMYFMPVEGQKRPWNHKQAWNNMANYMDSFLVGKGRGAGKDELPVLFADAMMDINGVGGPNKRKGWRMQYSLDGHYEYDDDNTINGLKTFKAMEAIGYEAVANSLDTDQMDGLLKALDPAQTMERKNMFRYIYKRYFAPDPSKFQESDLDNYLSSLKKDGEKAALKKIKDNNGDASIISGSWEDQISYETSKLFMKNAKAHYVAARFPSKFLRMDRNRFTEDGVSLWERIYREVKADKKWDRAEFDLTMKDLTMTEMLFRREISEQIKEKISMDRKWRLSMIDDDISFRLTEDKIKKLLEKTVDGKGEFKSPKEIQRVVDLWNHIQTDLFKKDNNNKSYLDGKAAVAIKEYTFTFGLEDTDISLIPYRATGPRMIARAIKDTGSIEATVTPWLLKMPDILSEIAVSGKHDFTPIIEYLRAAKKAINDVHGSEGAQEFVYKVSGAVINYFKKDAIAKPLFGLFGLGRRNSIAAEYAGRSSAVWEWDSRDIDRYCVALESYRLLPLNPYDANKTKGGKFIGGQMEDRWIKLPFLKNPVKFGKKRHVDFKYNGTKLRKEHGADWKAITADMISQLLPVVLAFILWEYIKKAQEEAEGKKK